MFRTPEYDFGLHTGETQRNDPIAPGLGKLLSLNILPEWPLAIPAAKFFSSALFSRSKNAARLNEAQTAAYQPRGENVKP